jgi:phosphoribosylaminoimidazole-succinocarboxamide synthase
MTPVPPSINLRDLYQELTINPSGPLWDRYMWEGPTQSDIFKWQSQGFGVYQGKIRTVLSRDGRVQMLHSDRLTAFDRLIAQIPGKGAILNSISAWWFETLGKEVPNHYIAKQGSRALLTEQCLPYKVEVVVRGYLAGSMLRSYQSGNRQYCGVKLPDGLRPYARLPEPIITPTTKAKAFEHDEATTASEVIAAGICSAQEWDEISRLALKVFSIGTREFAKRGWILADCKYEFGRSQAGHIKLIDEVHTPDCSRLWIAKSYESEVAAGQTPTMLDKENVRRWLMERGFNGVGAVPEVPKSELLKLAFNLLSVAETLTGEPVVIP